MHEPEERVIACPFCGENITVFIDVSAGSQQYIEDCQVCCRPIEFDVQVDWDDTVSVTVRSDTE